MDWEQTKELWRALNNKFGDAIGERPNMGWQTKAMGAAGDLQRSIKLILDRPRAAESDNWGKLSRAFLLVSEGRQRLVRPIENEKDIAVKKISKAFQIVINL